MPASRAEGFRRSFQPKSWPFWGFHLFTLAAVIWSGWSWAGIGLALATYWIRMFWVTAAFHRYFSHRTFKTSRAFQFVLGLMAASTAQKGILWWAAHHRRHHKFSDMEGDIHSAKLDGFWWSHVGWIVGSDRSFDETDWDHVKDLSRFPELRWLNTYWWLVTTAYAAILFAVGGWHALLWGFFVSTVLLWHGSFSINSLSHVFGRRRYATADNSRNSLLLALITCGEGWHNNHHHYMTSVNQGWHWYQIDITYYVLRMFSWVGLVWDLRVPPRHVVRGEDKPVRIARTGPAAAGSRDLRRAA